MADWKFIDHFLSQGRLYAVLEDDNKGKLTVFLTADEMAALGRQGVSLYDGQPKKAEG